MVGVERRGVPLCAYKLFTCPVWHCLNNGESDIGESVTVTGRPPARPSFSGMAIALPLLAGGGVWRRAEGFGIS